MKSLRQAFFDRHRLPADARFSNYEVAQRVAGEVGRAKRELSKAEVQRTLEAIPFVADELTEEATGAIVDATQLGKQPQLTSDDLRKMQQEEYLAEVEHQLTTRAAEQAQAMLEEERKDLLRIKEVVEQERKTLEALKSELDSLPPDVEVEKLINLETVSAASTPPTVWWRELGLESDPFAGNQGLFGIPKAKYDEVVVQTPFVKSFVDRVENTPDELLGKTIVVLGQFGSGKTTLFQLIAYRAGRSGVLPILTTVNPDQSVTKLTHQLISQVALQVSEAFRYRSDALAQSLPILGDEIGSCIQIMSAAAKVANTRGFLVFVDGLHKTVTYQRQSLEFLQQLQNFQERMAHAGLSCGMLVAGSLEWEVELTENPSLSGSFYRIEKIPVLSEENAVEAVIRRIYSFLTPSAPKPTVVREPLRQAFRVLSTRLLNPPTFRDYLDHVRDRLVGRHFAEIGISVTLHMESIESVRREIQNSRLAQAYQQLSEAGQQNRTFRRALRIVLPNIYVRKGISEADSLFRTNKGAFLALRNRGFIVPHRSQSANVLVWHLSPELVSFLQNVYDKHRITPTDTLEALFIDPAESLPQEAETIYTHVKAQMRSMAASWRSSWPEVADLVDKTVTRIARIEKSSENIERLSTAETLDDIRSSLQNMAKLIMLVIGDRDALLSFDFEKYANSWCAGDNVDVLKGIVERTKPLPPRPSECFGILHQHAQALTDLSILLSDLVRGEAISRINGRKLTLPEMRGLHEARTLFLAQNYAETVDKLSEILDAKIKDVVYPTIRCALGPRFLSLLPGDVQGKLTDIQKQEPRGHPRAKRLADKNFLYDVSRSEYPKIVFAATVRPIVFGDSIPEGELLAIKDSLELMLSLEDRRAHRDRPSYFRKHATEIADALKAAPRFCEALNTTILRLSIGIPFSLRKSGEHAIEFKFELLGTRSVAHRIDEAQVEATIIEILSLLEAGPLSFPPIENLTGACHDDPEICLGLLRGAVNEGLLQFEETHGAFSLIASISEKGARRLDLLRARRAPS